MTCWIIKALVCLQAKYGHFLPRANFLPRIVWMTQHITCSAALTPNDSHPIAPIYSSVTHSSTPSDKSTRPTHKVVFLKKPLQSFKDTSPVRPCRRRTFVHQRAPASHNCHVSETLTVEWTGQRLRTSYHTRSRPKPPSQEPCGPTRSGLKLEFIKYLCHETTYEKDVRIWNQRQKNRKTKCCRGQQLQHSGLHVISGCLRLQWLSQETLCQLSRPRGSRL